MEINPFATPGPWIHSCSAALGHLNPQHRPTEDRLTQIIYGEGLDGATLSQCRSLVKSVLKHAQECFRLLKPVDRGTVAYHLKLQSTPGTGVANNNTTPAIRNGFLPLLVLDAILHAKEPSCVGTAFPRQQTRPKTENVHLEVDHVFVPRFLRADKFGL